MLSQFFNSTLTDAADDGQILWVEIRAVGFAFLHDRCSFAFTNTGQACQLLYIGRIDGNSSLRKDDFGSFRTSVKGTESNILLWSESLHKNKKDQYRNRKGERKQPCDRPSLASGYGIFHFRECLRYRLERFRPSRFIIHFCEPSDPEVYPRGYNRQP